MYTYNLTQWFIFFYLYSFIGWVWESCYVSAKKRHWVNRGFMNGPFLPIYGFGALTILISTMGVRESTPLIFLFGMTGATILEYVTGAVMEYLFHVRYWDYSNQKLNLHGYICVTSSLAWGVFSILLVKFVHLPVETAVMKIPEAVTEGVAFVLTIVVACDFMQSFREAIDLKETLVKLSESNEHIRRMQKRLEVASAFAEQDYEEYQQKFKVQLAKKDEFLRNIEEFRMKQQEKLKEVNQKLTEALESGKQKTDEISKLQEMLMKEVQEIGSRTTKKYRYAARQIRRNPGMISEKYAEALQEIHEMMRKKEEK